jgi:hypothetical protein
VIIFARIYIRAKKMDIGPKLITELPLPLPKKILTRYRYTRFRASFPRSFYIKTHEFIFHGLASGRKSVVSSTGIGKRFNLL